MTRAVATFVTIFVLVGTAAAAAAPEGWFLAGSRPQDYLSTADAQQPRSGTASALLQSRPGASPEGFGTLMQSFDAKRYAGKRVRLTADVRARNVEQWAGLWMRVDAMGHRSVAFDNMQDRPIAGTRDWKTYAVVLDVPAEGEKISFGVLLAGSGEVWLDNVRFEEVDASVPTTGRQAPSPRQTEPLNLDFEAR